MTGLPPAITAVRPGDLIIPRTETPGALDVRVPAFIESLVGGSWMEDARTAFQTGLDVVQLSADPEALREASRRTARFELRLGTEGQGWRWVEVTANPALYQGRLGPDEAVLEGLLDAVSG